jgi:hypothetical protein
MRSCELEGKPCIAVQTHYLHYLGVPVCAAQALVGKPFVIAEMKKCPKDSKEQRAKR